MPTLFTRWVVLGSVALGCCIVALARPDFARGADPKPTAVLKGHEKKVTLVSFAPGGRPLVVTSSEDGTVRLWSLETGKELARLNDDVLTGSALSVAWHPKSPIVAISYGKFEQNRRAGPRPGEWLVVWDISTANKPKRISRIKGVALEVMAFSPDGAQLAGVFESDCHIYDFSKDKELRLLGKGYLWRNKPGFVDTIFGHSTHISFSPNGERIGVVHTFNRKKMEQNLALVEAKAEKGGLRVEDEVEAAADPKDVDEHSHAVVSLGFVSENAPFVLTEHGRLKRWRIARNGKVDQKKTDSGPMIGDGSKLKSAVPTTDGKGFVTMEVSGTTGVLVKRWDISDGKEAKEVTKVEVELAVDAKDALLVLSPDGTRFAMTAKRQAVEVYAGPPAKGGKK